VEYDERHAANVDWLKQAFAEAKRQVRKGLMIFTQANPYFEDHWPSGRQQSMHITPRHKQRSETVMRMPHRKEVQHSMRYIVPVLSLIVVYLAYGADYGREKKWADEITPGIVVGDPVYLEGGAGHKFLTIYTTAPNAQAGLVIVHGIGVHPDHGLINTLRIALADYGYTTLSVQMPVLAAEAGPAEYLTTFGEAGERLKVAVEFLHARGYKKIAIVSHSMGSRMTHAYLTSAPGAPVNAWVCIGLGGEADFRPMPLPVFDLYGENDLPAVVQGAQQRAASIQDVQRSQQVMAPQADHFFTNQQAELVRYVRDFLDRVL
jgi:alpha/beta superfamily hydrolase